MDNLINIGLIGHKFMGKAHSHAYKDVSMFFDLKYKPHMKVICGIEEDEIKEAAKKYGWSEYTTKWEEVVNDKDIEVVDISSPSDTHLQIALAAAEKGKHIFCEKPMATTLEESRMMLASVEKHKVKHMIGFNYRRVPAVQLAKRLIDEGKIGKIHHFRGVYLQDWIVKPEFPLVWRLQKKIAGSGALGDIGAHIIDLARFLVGELDEVCAVSETFIKERPILDNNSISGLEAKADNTMKMGTVDVDDATTFIARFSNGALCNIESTRFATGRKNGLGFEINGSLGSLKFEFENMNILQYYSGNDPQYITGFKNILVTESVHPYINNWWPAGHIIGFEHTFVHEIADFLTAISSDSLPTPNFYDGVACQRIITAVEKSAEEHKWVKLDEI